jgi:hypothetical protein
VGSTVNKIVRKDNFMIDIILNYNKSTLLKGIASEEEQLAGFTDLVERVRELLE